MLGFIDTETNNKIFHKITKFHCIAYSIDYQPVVLAVTPEEIKIALDLLGQCDTLSGHNIIQYDLPVLHKFFKWKFAGKIVDTLVLSRLLFPDLLKHSLAYFGEQLGVQKMEYEDAFGPGDPWLQYNEKMGEYCKQDVTVLIALYDFLKANRKDWDWDLSLEIETQFAKDFTVQGLRGVYIDKPFTEQLIQTIESEMAEIEKKIEPLLPTKPPTQLELKSFTPPKRQLNLEGLPTKITERWFERVWEHEGSYFGEKWGRTVLLPHHEPLITETPMTLSDQTWIKAWLMKCGWEPTMWSYKKQKDRIGKMRLVKDETGQLIPTHPKFHDKGVLCPNLELVSDQFSEAKAVVRWVVIRHRHGLIKSIYDAIREDGTVSATGHSNGTPTGRVRHSIVANIPKAEEHITLGRECRQIFIARPGRILMGVDAAGLEMRMLAHYMDDPEFTESVLNGTKEAGTDVISLLYSTIKDVVKDRSTSKNVTYGWLYGASDKKLGQTAGYGDDKAAGIGSIVRMRWESRFPKLGTLMNRCNIAAARGHIVALDGRKIPIRAKHATLNTLLQSAGSICVKVATNYMNEQVRNQKLDAFQVIHYHDEILADCKDEETGRKAGQLFINGLHVAEELFNLKCQLNGEIQVGLRWSDVH